MASFWRNVNTSASITSQSWIDAGESTRLGGIFMSVTGNPILLLVFAALPLFLLLARKKRAFSGAPVYDHGWSWEPILWSQVRFVLKGRDIVRNAYNKFKDRPFVLKGCDVDVMVMPNRYLEELRLISHTKLSSVKALVATIGGKWTFTTVMTESNLHFKVIQNKLIPELHKFIHLSKIELDHAWPTYVPSPTEWIEVDIHYIVQMLINRMSAKVLVGYPACRDPRWLHLARNFPMDVFAVTFILRLCPAWTHPIVAHLIPQRYKLMKHLREARRVLRPLMEKHRDAVEKRSRGEQVDEEDSLLHWMMDHGTEDEVRIDKMAIREAIIALASLHTTSMAITNIILDLCAYPQWIPVLRAEIDEITAELGPIGGGSTPQGGLKQWLERLEKLDSFFVESQRMNPPILLAPQRLAVEGLTLKDGTHIPKGSRICWAGTDHVNDAKITPDPEIFDPMRSYKKRHASPGNMNNHLAGKTSPDYLPFGYGNQACPGRRFAVDETKLIVARLISEYDIRFPDATKSRPLNQHFAEHVYPDPKARVMIRLREKAL